MVSKYQQGAVSIFAVIFSTLLLTVLTVSFIGLMISAQQRAINNDLSQSAYDSALAGVEDAKRVVRACVGGDSTACAALDGNRDCQVIARAGVNGAVGDRETRIASNSTSGEEFDQAYTCVNISMDSADYLLEASSGRAYIVPLNATGPVDKVTIEWYSAKDNNNELMAVAPTPVPSDSLPGVDDWDNSAPSLIRAQLITPGENFSLSSLDDSAASRTLFLRPSSVTTGNTSGTIVVGRNSQLRATSGNDVYSNSLNQVTCSSNFKNNGFACSVTLDLADEDVISMAASNNAVLRINSLYKGANVRVTMQGQDGSRVMFDGVQPIVDSTGRASTLFRRVEARLRMGVDFAYPSYVVDIENNLCKNFSVDASSASGSGCNP